MNREQKYQNRYRALKREQKVEIEAQEAVAGDTQELDGQKRAQCLLDNL